ncbi:MAG: hypothetical protein U1A27_15000 [Phycisphaerae bacterium]
MASMRTGSRIKAAALVMALAAAVVSEAEAGWLSRIMAAAEHGGARVARSGASALESAAARLQSLSPSAAKGGALAAGVSQEGHWTFINRAGERFTAATPDELKRAATVLLPDAAADARPTLILTEDTVFVHRDKLKDLPNGGDLRVAVGADSYPLIRRTEGSAERLYAEALPNVIVEVGERRLFDEALWQLSRPLEASRFRMLSLEPDGPQTLARLPRPEPGSPRATVDAIDPARLPSALGALDGQTVLLTGRIEGEQLFYRPSSGGERSLPLGELRRAAAANDVDLIVLNSPASRQPGGRNWLWQRVEVAGLDGALGRARLADFFNALASPDSKLMVAASEPAAGRVSLRAVPVNGANAEPRSSKLGDLMSEMLSELTGQVVSASMEADVKSSSRQAELDSRIVPGIPAALQFGYIGALVLGVMGLPVLRHWWGRIWPAEQRGEYSGLAGFLAARAARLLAFVMLFLPVAGIPAAVWSGLLGVWFWLTLPARLWRRLLGRSAPAG